ncbi:MAG: response regulator transcription factor [Roseiflexaceae bacterium]|nr:response regulator transcription factor [Roseiflexaceae bacterium]
MIHVGVVAAAMTLRVGLREVLNSLPGVLVVAEAAHPEEFNARDADVLVLTGSFDPEALEKTMPILLLTEDPADAQHLFALALPAWGVLPINANEAELAAALSALAEGLWVGAPALMRNLLSRKPVLDEAASTGETLTAREMEVLQLTAQGLPNKQIALVLGISEHTIKFHLSSLYAKLGVTSRTEAVRAGARRGWVVL